MEVKAMVDANSPRPRESILDIKPYVPGGHAVEGHAEPIVLSANETPLGPSRAARDAFRQAAGSLERYPDGSAHALREAIAEVYGIAADRIVAGAGSDELLNLIAQSYLNPGDEAIHTAHGFLVYKIATLAAGGKPVVALPSTARGGTVSRIVPALAEGAGVVTTRAHVHYIATEFGAVDLFGQSTRKRAELLISIAHPDHRGDLRNFAKGRKLFS